MAPCSCRPREGVVPVSFFGKNSSFGVVGAGNPRVVLCEYDISSCQPM
jgi:hypothetical protein